MVKFTVLQCVFVILKPSDLYFSTAWQGLENAMSISLWKVCYKMHKTKTWACYSWEEIPGKYRTISYNIIVYLICIICSYFNVTSPGH